MYVSVIDWEMIILRRMTFILILSLLSIATLISLFVIAIKALIKQKKVSDIKTFEVEETKATNLYPSNPETVMSTSFSHIFQGGYSSGYYSYKWAEVLDADAFAYFLEKGIFNSEVATKFKDNVLSKGGTELPMELYKKFRGQEPKVEALLKRAGLL